MHKELTYLLFGLAFVFAVLGMCISTDLLDEPVTSWKHKVFLTYACVHGAVASFVFALWGGTWF